MYLLVLFFPFLGFIIPIFFGRYIGRGAFFISTFAIGMTLLVTLLLFYEVVYNFSIVYVDLGYWLNLTHIQIGWSFLFDSVTVSMLFIISLISFLVHFYSIYYMYNDKHYPRFMAYLSLFTFFMILLVTSNNLLLLFFGWEGVGLISYFLINFWYTRVLANKAALKAFLINKFGDIFLLIGILALTIEYGSLDLEIIFSLLDFEGIPLFFITFMILIGVVSKSAQFGLHTWLPDAMEGFIWALPKFHYMLEQPHLILKSTGSLPSEKSLIDEVDQQETFDKKGSSETLRETFDSSFLDWLVGFTEGDGSFISNSDGSLEFKITPSSTDAQILFYIKKQLGFGHVSLQDKISKTHHYRVRDKENLYKLIQIFNGYLCTYKKKEQFKLWLINYNFHYKSNISFIDNSPLPKLNNSWLSGFTDAEGCFTSSILKSNQIQVRYILSQQGEKELLEFIGKLIKGRLSYLKSYNGYNLTVNLTYLNVVINYFKKYKLKTKKRISFVIWLKIYNLKINSMKEKRKLTDLEFEKIKKWSKKINNFKNEEINVNSKTFKLSNEDKVRTVK